MTIEPNEQPILTFRRHPLFLILQLIGLGISSFGVLFFVSLVCTFLGLIYTQLFPPLLVLWFVIVGFLAFESIYIYHHTYWELTNFRLVMHIQRSLFGSKSDQCRLEQIQDEPEAQTGLLSLIFDYGDIRIQTAGSDQPFMLNLVQNPRQVTEAIMAATKARVDAPKPVYQVSPPAP